MQVWGRYDRFKLIDFMSFFVFSSVKTQGIQKYIIEYIGFNAKVFIYKIL